MKKITLFLPLFLFFCAPSSNACTTFAISSPTEMTLGKSYDWYAGHGVAFVNKSNIEKEALDIENNFAQRAKWQAQYGSLSFSQFGLDLPLGGINEEGLVVEIMWLSRSDYPTEKKLPELNELQWIQYILDTSATTAEAVEQSKMVQVTKFSAPVHYLVCDRSKTCSTFEYVDGQMVIHEDVDVRVLTNNTYDSSLDHLSQFSGFGGQRRIPNGSGSLERFVRAASDISKLSDVESSARAFDSAADILSSVKSPWFVLSGLTTRWQLIYQIEDGRVGFKTPSRSKYRFFDPSELNYDCSSDSMALDLTGEITGRNDWKFQEYSQAFNQKLLEVGNESIGSPLSSSDLEKIKEYTSKRRQCL